MNEDEKDVAPNEGDEVARLLRLMPAPEAVPDAAIARAKAAARQEWQQTVRQRRRRKWAYGLAAAAVMLAGGLMILKPGGLWLEADVVATLETVAGQVTSRGDDVGLRQALERGDSLSSGMLIETGADSRAAFRLAGGQSLRLDTDSSVVLRSSRVVELRRGGVYLDSDEARGFNSALEIRTDYGTARDIGTQFEVRIDGAAMRVRVREGLVRVDLMRIDPGRVDQGRFDQGERTVDAGVGAELTVRASGEVHRSSVPLHGDPWQWNLTIAPPFDLEGRTLRQFLGWVVRETGWRLQYAEPWLESKVGDITLHGELEGLTADVALPIILETCGLTHQQADGILLIETGGN